MSIIKANQFQQVDGSVYTYLRQVYYAKTDVEVETSSTSYQPVISVQVPMNTNKYRYLIEFLTPARNGTAGGGEAIDLAILLNGTTVSEAGHRLHSMPGSCYANQQIRTMVTSGYTTGANITVTGAIAVYSSGIVNTHDNHSIDTGSSIVVYELYK